MFCFPLLLVVLFQKTPRETDTLMKYFHQPWKAETKSVPVLSCRKILVLPTGVGRISLNRFKDLHEIPPSVRRPKYNIVHSTLNNKDLQTHASSITSSHPPIHVHVAQLQCTNGRWRIQNASCKLELLILGNARWSFLQEPLPSISTSLKIGDKGLLQLK